MNRMAALLVIAIGSFEVSLAHAVCNPPDLLESFPPQGAQEIATSSHLFAHYSSQAEYGGEEVSLLAGEKAIALQASFDSTEGLLRIAPAQRLEPLTSYTIHWPALRGLSTAGRGTSSTVSFTTGAAADLAPLSFDGVLRASWSVEREKDACTDGFEDRYLFKIFLGEGPLDASRSTLQLLVFQSGGGNEAPEQVLLTHLPDAGEPVFVRRTIARATGHVCFAALARDLGEQVSSSADRQACVDTTPPPFFAGCALALPRRGSAGGDPSPTGALLCIGLSLIWLGRRRSHRVLAQALWVQTSCAPLSTKSSSAGMPCTDVGDQTVCFGSEGAVHVHAKPQPDVPASSAQGLRCVGSGAARKCRDRRAMAGPFACQGGNCRQTHPRMPDDGEWLCGEDGGAVLCRGGEPPAGLARSIMEPGWFCGSTRTQERVCIDFDPDFPEAFGHFSCRYTYEEGVERVCVVDPAAHLLGDRCDRDHPCLVGANCVSSRCVPPSPRPSCTLARDCASGACRFGTCAQ